MEVPQKKMSMTELRAKFLKVLDELDSEGVIITNRGRPVAKLIPLHARDNRRLIGSIRGKVVVKGDISATSRRWRAQT